MLLVAVARSSSAWRRCDAVCTSGAVTNVVSTHNGQAKRCESGVYSKRLNRGQHGFDTATNTQSDPPGAALDRGWSLISTLALLQTAGGETRSSRECACAAVEYDVLLARSQSSVRHFHQRTGTQPPNHCNSLSARTNAGHLPPPLPRYTPPEIITSLSLTCNPNCKT